MNTSFSFLSTSNPPSSPIVVTPGKGLLFVQSSSLIALTHFPLYFTSKGQSPVGSSCFRNGFLSCHPHDQALPNHWDHLLATFLPLVSPYSSPFHPATGMFFQKSVHEVDIYVLICTTLSKAYCCHKKYKNWLITSLHVNVYIHIIYVKIREGEKRRIL